MEIIQMTNPTPKPEIEAASEVHTLTATNPEKPREYQDISIVLQDMNDPEFDRPLVTLEIETNDMSFQFIQAIVRAYFPNRKLAILLDLD